MEHTVIEQLSVDAAVTVEARLFNSLQWVGGTRRTSVIAHLPAGSTVADLVRQLHLPEKGVHLVLRNGRPVAWNGRNPAAISPALKSGDVIAFSGPVPVNWQL